MSVHPMSQALPAASPNGESESEDGAPSAPAPPTTSGALPLPPPQPQPMLYQRSQYAQQGTWWLYVIERFGFPTLVCFALGYMLYQNAQDERLNHREERAAVVKQLTDMHESMDKQAKQLEDMGRTLIDVKDVLKERLPRGR